MIDVKSWLPPPYARINKRIAIVLPWTLDLNLDSIQVTECSVWVDLIMLHTVLEIEAYNILSSLGRVVYNGTTHSRSKFSHIHGYVVMDLAEDLPTWLVVNLEGVSPFCVEVFYCQLPNTCAICKGVDHLPRLCPNRTTKPTHEQQSASSNGVPSQ